MTEVTQLLTTRFGAVEYHADDVIEFRQGLIGFPDLQSFLVLQHKEGSPFRWLQSIDDPAVAFLMTEPLIYCPDYAPDLDERTATELEISEETARLVFCLVTIPKGQPEAMTLNLAGPILINAENKRAKQVVLEDPRYEIKYSPNSGSNSAEPAAA